ncbi:F-box domain-containing protein [Mycena sanguinolenta]|uniref:F-box domain-containing protein n=1 Tax=Mycena sanguinolenta TaxID=230812 RepID=A0A8H6YA83_9AGAR|nr:F-box domain-containing protein [Mycena sanguinolenta]
MDRIPVEVWLQVFSILDRGDWIFLHRVSRAFHRISRPLLFKHLHFYPYAAVPYYGRTTPEFLIPGEVEIKRTIRRLRFWTSDDVAPLVRECTVAPQTIGSAERGSYAACHDGDVLLRTFVQLLPRLTNLRKLSAFSVEFKQPFIDALVSVPNLKEIELGSCVTKEGITADHQLNVERLSFLDADRYGYETVGAQNWFSIVDMQMLTHLCLLSRNAVRTILNAGTAAPAFLNVVALAVDVNSLKQPRDLVALRRFPAVRQVHISMYVEPPQPSNPSLFPVLDTYHGPPEFLMFLDSRAPLRRLQIDQCLPARVGRILEFCAHTLRGVTKLTVSFDGLPIVAFHPIVEAFPSLVEFRMHVSLYWATPPGEIFTAQSLYLDLAEASPFPSGLQAITIVWWSDNGPDGLEVVPAAQAAWATLSAAHSELWRAQFAWPGAGCVFRRTADGESEEEIHERLETPIIDDFM